MASPAELGASLGLPALLAALTLAGALCLRRLFLSPFPLFVAAGLAIAFVPGLLPPALAGLPPSWATVLLVLPLLYFSGVSLTRPPAPRAFAVPLVLGTLGLGATAAILAWASGRILAIGPAASALVALALAIPDPFAARSLRGAEPAAGGLADLLDQETAIAGVVAIGAAAVAEAAPPLLPVAGREAARVLGGTIVGLGVGTLAAAVLRRLTDPLAAAAGSFFFGYGAFVVAEGLGLGGVAAGAVAGIVTGGRLLARGRATAAPVRRTWEALAVGASALGLAILGARVRPQAIAGSAAAILVLALLAVLVRALVVYGCGGMARALTRGIPFRWLHALLWGGLPGAPTAAVAVAFLGAAGPDIEKARAALFGVLVIHACARLIPARTAARWLGLALAPAAGHELEAVQARLTAVEAGLAALERFSAPHEAMAGEADDLRLDLQLRRQALRARLVELATGAGGRASWPRELVLREVLAAELAAIEEARDRGIIPGGIAARVAEEIDLEIRTRLRRARGGGADARAEAQG